jgi:heme exporter protein B
MSARSNPWAALFAREWRLAIRQGGGAGVGLVFFLILVAIQPFGIGPDLALLSRIAPAVLWIGALLATLLALDRLFQGDEEDGSLDLLLASGRGLEAIVAVKCLAHWAASVAPLVVATPLFGVMLGLEGAALGALALTLLVGTPALTFLGAIGAALTVTLRRGGLLLAVLVLPFAIPILVFGVAAASAVIVGPTRFETAFAMLAGLSLATIALSPFAAAAALRLARE